MRSEAHRKPACHFIEKKHAGSFSGPVCQPINSFVPTASLSLSVFPCKRFCFFKGTFLRQQAIWQQPCMVNPVCSKTFGLNAFCENLRVKGYTQLHHAAFSTKRIKMVATSARVALPSGASMELSVPFISPFSTAQFIASTA